MKMHLFGSAIKSIFNKGKAIIFNANNISLNHTKDVPNNIVKNGFNSLECLSAQNKININLNEFKGIDSVSYILPESKAIDAGKSLK